MGALWLRNENAVRDQGDSPYSRSHGRFASGTRCTLLLYFDSIGMKRIGPVRVMPSIFSKAFRMQPPNPQIVRLGDLYETIRYKLHAPLGERCHPAEPESWTDGPHEGQVF